MRLETREGDEVIDALESSALFACGDDALCGRFVKTDCGSDIASWRRVDVNRTYGSRRRWPSRAGFRGRGRLLRSEVLAIVDPQDASRL